ncbi:2-C-methyl-D-erythritol 4-phosphate cytidylyltransferase [Cellulomonas sp. RIT-PI-Y]|uniref:2-C-methyl-D-erythritol 4-phosphate cytidylyltransferase n=1 Tax=Cellulomonas sp. RIT-PI-Y TaxID=3035297 RepID=UPI0021DA0736|nr:2-C-methyl-D-erythritol 4-phosphate cytidylyltransferase [Cellulomonas sp. RIT-PI-Y]
MTATAIITAAGSGLRLGHPEPKALVRLNGTPLLQHAARRLVMSGVVDALAVTAPAGHETAFRALLPDAVVVTGGATRQESVAAALAVLHEDCDLVLVHDAARPLASPELIARVVEALRAGHRAVVPGLPVTDTITAVDPSASSATAALGTVPRAGLRAVQTPQGFHRDLLDAAHAAAAPDAATHAAGPGGTPTAAAPDATDDAGLVEALGVPVWLIPGEESALKITTARDLALAELLLAGG